MSLPSTDVKLFFRNVDVSNFFVLKNQKYPHVLCFFVWVVGIIYPNPILASNIRFPLSSSSLYYLQLGIFPLFSSSLYYLRITSSSRYVVYLNNPILHLKKAISSKNIWSDVQFLMIAQFLGCLLVCNCVTIQQFLFSYVTIAI